MSSKEDNDMSDWHWHEALRGSFEQFLEAGHDEEEAKRLAQWDTRHWWSDSDSHALDRLHPWLPPHLRDK
ncbi:hypothetical protein [Kutzneria albida]|uniref:Uncharacterized protein n=1 Tax=Kutzneria albida DSM 43870 TaxID=1449976 RepID=W5WAX3_9PSEU|nr:hypothetical protein [Kutzneria albida]AHH98283.1 hypothetical protein KALB_4921 [Kutzneria albida DSM 43870]